MQKQFQHGLPRDSAMRSRQADKRKGAISLKQCNKELLVLSRKAQEEKRQQAQPLVLGVALSPQ